MAKKSIRIGCASAFYGDSQLAARQLVDKGDIDFLVFDYLAEATMAILARAKAKDSQLGYAVDFVTVAMKDVLADCARKGIKVIANAGGVNVPGCVRALEGLCDTLGLELKVAGVYGDDLMDRRAELATRGLTDTDSGVPLPQDPASINAYLGAEPIADALRAGADIVVTGRVVDSALVLGPLIQRFSWAMDAYDRLAQGSLAGHIIECGAQCTGGNFTDWRLVPDFADMSYPVAEVCPDGSFAIDMPPGTGGMVSPATVGEQILYEIGDPANYLLPDVACDFTRVTVRQSGTNRVAVTGARGRAPGPDYKICATSTCGYRLLGSFYMAGLDAADKARANLDAWVRRTRTAIMAKGLGDYRQVSLEVVGAEDIYGPNAAATGSRDVMAKFGLQHDSKAALAFAAAEMAYLATSAAPGMTGFAAGRARPQPLMHVHSVMLAKAAVPVTLQVGNAVIAQRPYGRMDTSPPAADAGMDLLPLNNTGPWQQVPLIRLAVARSGDKGDSANIGVMAREERFLPLLDDQLTTDAVANWFAHLVEGPVTRYALPGIGAYNFLLQRALGGGATASLRLDSQGKTYAQMLLSMPLRVPTNWGLE